MKELFSRIDKDGSGSLDYAEFTLAVFGRESQGKGQVQKRPPVQART